MKDKHWVGLHYIDLFAGAGIEKLDKSGELDWGSPLIAAHAPFTRLHLCEKNLTKFQALKERIKRLNLPTTPQVLHGDSNNMVGAIVKEIPPRTLSLAFLDPYGLHLHFETIQRLSSLRVDLIIFFPDHVDALRNWEKVYLGQEDSNLDLVLGKDVDWYRAIHDSPHEKWPDVLRELYENQLRTLGYKYFDDERISNKGRFLYRLIFCAKHKLAAKLWRKVAKKKPDGQYTFDFGS
jgi:three-Cys-motif partner protein